MLALFAVTQVSLLQAESLFSFIGPRIVPVSASYLIVIFVVLLISAIDIFNPLVLDIMNIVIDEFALSCRAMGKKVEHSFLIYLIRLFNSERYVSLDISVVENSRNQQMVRTLENAGFEKGEISERGEHTFSKYSFTQKDVYPEFPVWFELEIDD